MPVPAAATKVPIGQIPRSPCEPTMSQACDGAQVTYDNLIQNLLAGGYPLDVPGLGIPVGGVGSGSFMINQSGTFGPWNFGGSQDAGWENRILPQAAFHFREQVGSSSPSVTTLAAKGPNVVGSQGPVAVQSWGSPLSSWNVLKPGQGTYSALYPFGWESYTGFKTDVSTMFYSPIVAGEDKPTSLPVVYFDVKLTNTGRASDKVSMMFTMPNAPDHTMGTPASVRTGYTSTYRRDRHTGVEAVTLGANSPGNTPDAANSSWTIAARPGPRQHVSYTTSWNAEGDGSDVYAPFTKSGSLPDQPIEDSKSAGAIAVSADLAPGETQVVPFALAWDFPQVSFHDYQTTWMRRYTNFYGARETAQNDYIAGSYPGDQGFDIANDALAAQSANLARVRQWYDPIADNPKYPLAIRTGALNQLSQLVFNDSFWEGGLVSNSVTPTGGRRLGTQTPGTHMFDTADAAIPWSQDSDYVLVNNANELDVDAYGWLAYSELFPNLERDRLLAQAESAMLDPYGGQTQIYGVSPDKDPFVSWPVSTAPTPGGPTFIDIPAKNIFRYYGYAKINHDRAFLKTVHPAMQKQLRYLQALIPSGSSLPVGPAQYANTYEYGVNGPDVYDSSLYILSLETVIATGRSLGAASPTLAALDRQLRQAKAEFESTFWDAEHHAYRMTPGATPDAYQVLLDTFFAENVAEQIGLPDVLDVSHMRDQLTAYYDVFMRAHDSTGALVGAPNTAPPLGSGAATGEVWTGSNYEVASTYINAGKRFHDPSLIDDGITMSSAISHQIWQTPSNGYAFDAPEAWHSDDPQKYRYPDYSRALAVWDDIDALHPIRQAR
ncbi:GH116 family glycosyl-hydrolase [Streptomyces sp. NPDC090088]|uniref:GH116 family glycosyl-hydrolase n=1 Tax=Streptomyces sp. NPDC090088 TaxID=3365944 RepID=UPI00380358DF